MQYWQGLRTESVAASSKVLPPIPSSLYRLWLCLYLCSSTLTPALWDRAQHVTVVCCYGLRVLIATSSAPWMLLQCRSIPTVPCSVHCIPQGPAVAPSARLGQPGPLHPLARLPLTCPSSHQPSLWTGAIISLSQLEFGMDNVSTYLVRPANPTQYKGCSTPQFFTTPVAMGDAVANSGLE